MTATAAQIAQVRRMVNEPPNSSVYTDAIVQAAIEKYTLPDENGEEPRIPAIDMTRPVTYVPYMDVTDLVTNPDWIATYDLNAAAADIWDEKAAAVASQYDFNVDGGNYSRSQLVTQYEAQARKYRSRRSVYSIRSKPQPHRRYSGSVQ